MDSRSNDPFSWHTATVVSAIAELTDHSASISHALLQNHIDGCTLLTLFDPDAVLRHVLGIRSLGHRIHIVRLIDELRQRSNGYRRYREVISRYSGAWRSVGKRKRSLASGMEEEERSEKRQKRRSSDAAECFWVGHGRDGPLNLLSSSQTLVITSPFAAEVAAPKADPPSFGVVDTDAVPPNGSMCMDGLKGTKWKASETQHEPEKSPTVVGTGDMGVRRECKSVQTELELVPETKKEAVAAQAELLSKEVQTPDKILVQTRDSGVQVSAHVDQKDAQTATEGVAQDRAVQTENEGIEGDMQTPCTSVDSWSTQLDTDSDMEGDTDDGASIIESQATSDNVQSDTIVVASTLSGNESGSMEADGKQSASATKAETTRPEDQVAEATGSSAFTTRRRKRPINGRSQEIISPELPSSVGESNRAASARAYLSVDSWPILSPPASPAPPTQQATPTRLLAAAVVIPVRPSSRKKLLNILRNDIACLCKTLKASHAEQYINRGVFAVLDAPKNRDLASSSVYALLIAVAVIVIERLSIPQKLRVHQPELQWVVQSHEHPTHRRECTMIGDSAWIPGQRYLNKMELVRKTVLENTGVKFGVSRGMVNRWMGDLAAEGRNKCDWIGSIPAGADVC